MPAATSHQHVELRQLEASVAVARELQFGRAAQKLHVGQPTLSDLVRRLERETGTPLSAASSRWRSPRRCRPAGSSNRTISGPRSDQGPR
ncbi:helix-turn-helix domain-containing protein [Mycobacterium sp. URHB0021]